MLPSILIQNLSNLQRFLTINVVNIHSLDITSSLQSADKTQDLYKRLHKAGYSLTDLNAFNAQGYTPLTFSIITGNIQMLQWLLEYNGIQINKIDDCGYTPLTYAIKHGNIKMVESILAHHRIDVNKVDGLGNTALTFAIQEGATEMVKLLLAHTKIDVNKLDGNGYTALALASRHGYSLCVTLLLKQTNINVNQLCTNDVFSKFSAFHFAVQYQMKGIYSLMFEDNRFDVNIKSAKGTPLDIAIEQCHKNHPTKKDALNNLIHLIYDGEMRILGKDTFTHIINCNDTAVNNVIATAIFEKGLLYNNIELVQLGFNKCTPKEQLLDSITQIQGNSFCYTSKTIINGKSALDIEITNDKLTKFVEQLNKPVQLSIGSR